MNTKNITILFIVVLSAFNNNLFSQKVYQNKKLKVYNEVLREKNNDIEIRLRFDIDSVKVPSSETYTIVPILKDANENQVTLPEIWINGKNRQKVYERRKTLNSNLDVYKDAYMIIEADDKAAKDINYYVTTPFLPWMKNAHLYIQKDKCGCADAREILDETNLGKILFRPNERYKPKTAVTFITPKAEAVKNRNEVGEAYLDFIVGRYNILPNFRRNPIELAKVDSLINQSVNDKNIIVNAIIFTGKASPEASYEYNKKLSQNRAKALQDYVNGHFTLKQEWLQAKSLGEDWDSFKKLMEQSQHNDREAILSIIRSNKEPDQKEKDLKTLNGGSTYKYLNEEIFPQLRRVECRVDYTVRAFSVEEGKDIIKKRPQQLSLNEMFLIANTYEKGSDEFNQVFDIAVQMFPDDEVANANSAATALVNGDALKARRYIVKCKESPDLYNNMGVLYLLEGNIDKAEEYFKLAKQNGVKEADENLNELYLKKTDNNLFDSFEN